MGGAIVIRSNPLLCLTSPGRGGWGLTLIGALEVSQNGAEEQTTGMFLVVIATRITFIDNY